MIENLFQDWRYEGAELLNTDVRAEEYEPVNVEAAASRAKDHLELDNPDGNGYIIPLFAEQDPTPTNEYVIYRPDAGHIGWFDAGFGINGSERFADCDRLNDKEIGHRLRFWLPENQSKAELDIDESNLPNDQIHPSDRLTSDQEDAFFRELKEFVRSEQEAERESKWEEYEELDLGEAIQRNRVSGPFVHIGRAAKSDEGPAYNYQILVEDDDSDIDLRGHEGIFSGNQCIIDTESEDNSFPVEAEILSVDDPQITIQPAWETIEDQNAVEKLLANDETELWVHDLLNPVPYERRLTAISQVKQNENKRALLTGTRPVEYTVNKYALPKSEIELNEYQRMAMIWADSADDVVCIHGPPGTGKTRTLTAYVRSAVSRGQSVLVTAHSNQAVDNLLVGDSTLHSPEEDTLHAMAQKQDDLSIARVGSNSRNRVVQNHYMNQSVSAADVVAATTSGAAQFSSNTFDVAVIDEATQASRPATAIVLNSARKIVLAGDHKQLPPYCADESMQEEDMHISLFEYLLNRYDDKISILLEKQYRMNEEIATFPNEAFYNGDLKTADGNRDWTVDGLKPLIGVDIQATEQRQDAGNSYYNLREAEAVAKQVKSLAQNGVDPEDIGIISAYSGQIGHIGGRVNQLDIDNPHAVSIDTVDSFQGSEREAIIVSFVRSNSSGYSGFLEFPEEGPRRLNVAVTRARKRLILVGNWETLGTRAPHRSADESCADLYANLADHLRSEERMLTPSVK